MYFQTMTTFTKSLRLITFTTIILCCYWANIFGQSEFVNTLYFNLGSYKINSKSLSILNQIGQKSKTDTLSLLKIFAYADTTGSEKYNDELSEKRAYQVYNYLVTRFNIDTTKVYMTWIGEDSDVYDLHIRVAHSQQRCVDIIAYFRKSKKESHK
jgi:outer membrane protein OmpA-like peptidoglycan-associated protein